MVLTAATAMGCDGCEDTDTEVGGGGASFATVSGGGFGGDGGSGGDGGDGGSGGSGGVLVCEDPTEGVALALTELYFGEGSNGEWKAVGLNIDGLVSDGNSTDVCMTNSGGDPDNAYPDGDGGIDNSFGKNLVPVLLGLSPTFPVTVNTYLDEGVFNTMLKVYCLPDEGDARGLTTKVFGGTDLGGTPSYDGTDLWPVTPEGLSDPQDPESSTLIFENSSVTGSTYDSGAGETIVLTIPIAFNDQTVLLKLTLYSSQVIMTLSEDRRSATGGVIAGVLNTEEFIDQVKKVAFLADYCDDPMYPTILQYVRRASDILTTGGQDPLQTCDGISFGIQFEMEEVLIGDVGPMATEAMACP